MLLNKRLDLDIAHSRLRKAHEADQEARVSALRAEKKLTITLNVHIHSNVHYRATRDQYYLHLTLMVSELFCNVVCNIFV